MENVFSGVDGDIATSGVLSNSFLNIGIDRLVGNSVAFINFTKKLLVEGFPEFFPNESMVVEILEDVEPDNEVINACKELSKKGYTIALDDFFYRKGMEPLIAVADIIKCDFRAMSPDKMTRLVEKLRKYNKKLLAEKVETNEEFEAALNMGFEYFQGYFFSKPEIIGGKDISPAQINMLEIMSEVNQRHFKFSKVEEIITRDVSISYKLLRYINSAYYRRMNEISSIKQAIVLLGEKGIRSFLSLIAMTNLSQDKPDELIRSSVIRAKFGELIAKSIVSRPDSSELFTLGLFSSIDALLDDTMENIMAKLPLAEAIKIALINGEGNLKHYLDIVKCYERGDWEGFSQLTKKVQIKGEKFPEHFLEAISWADALTSL
jgi:EAL and modified HD-GYP domain-containing signal transduction protein